MNQTPLVTKAEHIAGRKILSLEYRWGESCSVVLRALGWREVQSISTKAVEQKLDSDAHAALIVAASLGDGSEANIMDRLTAASAALVHRTALALSLGEKAITKNVQTPPVPEAKKTGSNNAGSQKAN
jgi:hypothetical protein